MSLLFAGNDPLAYQLIQGARKRSAWIEPDEQLPSQGASAFPRLEVSQKAADSAQMVLLDESIKGLAIDPRYPSRLGDVAAMVFEYLIDVGGLEIA